MERDQGFAEYAATHQQRMYRQAYLLTGDLHQAEDLVQATLLKLYRAWPRASEVEYLKAYSSKTLVRTYLHGRRKWRREHELSRLPAPARAADPTDLRLTLLAALADLPRRARAVVVLRFWDDLSVEQTAEALGCSQGTVKSQSNRALRLLRERLGENFHILQGH
ncbi:SigE family RNA polymerase sigma factor [Kribbella sp. DT2]|uniref:SigE family RNA polymerase sigma factor n=1 Tax=Kribbella sp. DT2 TaxID=3393427 RepID=UPI003CEECC9D